jgi:hypothetical protein
MKRIKNYLKPFLSWKFLLCFFLAWLITNGWSYIFIIIGLACDIKLLLNIGIGYQTFLWLPITPEKLITIPMAMWFNFRIFHDKQTDELLVNMKQQAKEDWQKIKNKLRRNK